MTKPLTIRFLEDKPLDELSVRSARGKIGIYFIFLTDLRIPYPYRSSRLVYIGMSESKQNSIGSRLRSHKSGQSANRGLTNYISSKPARFTYHTINFLTVLGTSNVVELETFFLGAFLNEHGCFPICNNQAGIEIATPTQLPDIRIQWGFFD
jgi:hypothetical protein